jgi:hypothetical protein
MQNLPLQVLVLLTISGCASSHRAAPVPPEPPAAINTDFRRMQDKAFSSRERDIIVAAQRHLAHSDKRPKGASDDAYYRVRQVTDGYEVFVIYVTGYEDRQPQFAPCFHNEVFLLEDGTVSKVLSGPECWPYHEKHAGRVPQ